ncbi:MAG: hypothetical protein ACKVX9_18765, partial [Blastocatellia bacterium]
GAELALGAPRGVRGDGVGNFLLTMGREEVGERAGAIFRRGIEQAARLKAISPSIVREEGFAAVAVFARENGSGGGFARDEGTGNWLAACGTWFHSEGAAVGEEARLLVRMARTGIDEVARELEGFFVIACYDARAREVAIITDLMGSRHCFVRDLGDCLAVSTSSLLLAGLAPARIDPVGGEEYLRAGVIYEDRTLFREVRKLAPATVYRLAAGRIASIRRYWSFDELEPDSAGAPAAIERLSEALTGAAARIGKVYASPVCDLTGGWDSRAVAASFLRAGVRFETTVSGPAGSPDVVIAARLAAIAAVGHRRVEPETPSSAARVKEAAALTDGEFDPVEYARIAEIHRFLAARFDASVNGSYGEAARGYWWELLWPHTGRRRPIDARSLAMTRYLTSAESPALFPAGAGLDLPAHLAGIIERCAAAPVVQPNTAQMDRAYLLARMQRWQGRIASATDQIWPCLSPFMFRSALEAALRTPPRHRRNNRLMRGVIHRLRPDLAAEPLESGAPALPLTLRSWPKSLPAPGVLVAKAVRKLAPLPATQGAAEPARLRLWREEEIAAALTPAGMRLGALIDAERLAAFLAASRSERFGFDAQWNRMLGLELALRSLA